MSSKERLIQAHILKELSEQIIMLENSAKANSDLMQELFDTNEDLTGRINEANRELKKKDAEIERLKGELKNTNNKELQYLIEWPDGKSSMLNVSTLLDARMMNEAFIKEVERLNATITSREAETESYREFYNELRKETLGKRCLPNIAAAMTPGDVLKNVINCNNLRHKYEKAFELLSKYLDTHEIFTGIPLIENRIIAMVDNQTSLNRREKAAYVKASKLNAEKRKLMQLIDRANRGYMTIDEAMKDYQCWLNDRRRRGKS